MAKLPVFADRIDQRLAVLTKNGTKWYPYRRPRRDGAEGLAFAATRRVNGQSLDVFFDGLEDFVAYVIVNKAGTGSFAATTGLPFKNLSWRTKRIAQAYEADESLRPILQLAEVQPTRYFALSNQAVRNRPLPEKALEVDPLHLPEGEEEPPRATSTVSRIVRDTAVTKHVKRLYDFKCQVCRVALPISSGPYAEGAHIRPLGEPHNGPDVVSNVLCLCPNHHVMFDGGTISVQQDYSLVGMTGSLFVHSQHSLNPVHLEYHRLTIARGSDA